MRHGSMTTVAAWIPDDTLELVEGYRWAHRMSRSEFIRESINLHLELIRRARQERKQHKHN